MCSRLFIALVICVLNVGALLFVRERSKHVVDLWSTLPTMLDEYDYSVDERQRADLIVEFRSQVHEIRTLTALVASLVGILAMSTVCATMCMCSEWLWRGGFAKRYRIIQTEPAVDDIRK
jgi:hypothetical protein